MIVKITTSTTNGVVHNSNAREGKERDAEKEEKGRRERALEGVDQDIGRLFRGGSNVCTLQTKLHSITHFAIRPEFHISGFS